MSTKRHAFYNAVGKLTPLAVSVATIPLLLEAIGEIKYGLLSIILITVGYFGLLDMGFGTAVAKLTSSEETKRDPNRKSQIISSAIAAVALTGIIGGVVCSLYAGKLLHKIFDLEATEALELNTSVHIISVLLPVVLASSILNGTLLGSKKFLELNIAAIVTQSLVLLLPLVSAIYIDTGLETLVASILFARITGISVQTYMVIKRAGIRPRMRAIDKKCVMKLLRFGGWVSISGFISPIMTSADRLLIGNQLGLGSVTTYSIPYQLTSKTTIFAASLSEALFPRISGETEQNSKELPNKSVISLIALTAPMVLLGILVSDFVVGLWISEAFASKAVNVTNILLVGFWINGLATVPYITLQSRGKPHLVAYFHAIEVVPYLIILYFGIRLLGIEGAALAFTTRVTADFFLLSFGAQIEKKTIALASFALAVAALTALAVHLGYKIETIPVVLTAFVAAALPFRVQIQRFISR